MAVSDEKPVQRVGRFVRRTGRLLAMHAVLTAVAVLLALPLLWMIGTALQSPAECAAGRWLPETPHWENFRLLFVQRGTDFGWWYWNSLLTASWVTFIQVVTGSLAAFSFSHLHWRGREFFFWLYLSTLMLPGVVLMIPSYQLMVACRLTDSYAGLILPGAFSAFGTFLLRQFMLKIPRVYDDAARLDGAGAWQLYWSIVLPLSKPALAALAIFTFIGNYHALFWPLALLKSVDRYTLPVGMLAFQTENGLPVWMAAVTLAVVPLILLFVLLQKHLIRGVLSGGIYR